MYGNSVTGNVGYSPSREQMTSLSYTNGRGTLFSLKYFYQMDSTICIAGPTANNGQIACIQDLVDDGRSEAFAYDELGRLISASTKGRATIQGGFVSENFDRYGNRLNQTVTSGSAYSNSLSFATASGAGAYTNRPDGYMFRSEWQHTKRWATDLATTTKTAS